MDEIRTNGSGVVIDGNHRLEAVIGSSPPPSQMVNGQRMGGARWMVVTPEMARRWLGPDVNVENRKKYENRIRMYNRDMDANAWLRNPQPIILNQHGVLRDGQHRLEAVVKHGRPVLMFVYIGPEADDARPVLDGHKPRGIADQWGMVNGIGSSRNKAAALRAVVRIWNGNKEAIQSVHDLDIWYDAYEEAVEWAYSAFYSTDAPKFKSPVVGALVLAYYADPVRIPEFAERLRSGVGLTTGMPEYTLREWLMTAKFHGSENGNDIALRTLTAAHAFLTGRSILIVRQNDAARDFFLSRARRP